MVGSTTWYAIIITPTTAHTVQHGSDRCQLQGAFGGLGYLVHDEVVEGLGVGQDDVLLHVQQVRGAHPPQLPEVGGQLQDSTYSKSAGSVWHAAVARRCDCCTALPKSLCAAPANPVTAAWRTRSERNRNVLHTADTCSHESGHGHHSGGCRRCTNGSSVQWHLHPYARSSQLHHDLLGPGSSPGRALPARSPKWCRPCGL